MAKGGTDTRFQLGHAEGLGHVVIGAGVKGGHLAVFQRRSRQDDHGHLAPGPDATNHLEPVEVGEAQVEHDHLRGTQGDAGEPLFGGRGHQHLMGLGRQREPQCPQEGFVVVDDQDPCHRQFRPARRKRGG